MKTRILFLLLFTCALSQAQIFVSANATGNNDGTNWTNAYTDLNTALAAANNGDDIWMTQGVYKPSTTDRTASFEITNSSLKIYGGFIGNETALSQRDFRANKTILSGDLNDDDVGLDYSGFGRDDNSYNVIKILAPTCILDGVTVSSGQGNGAATLEQEGSAILIQSDNFRIRNCVIEKNVNSRGGAIRVADRLGLFVLENSIVRDNLAFFAPGIYVTNLSSSFLNVDLQNNLFENNNIKNVTASSNGAVAWFRQTNFGGQIVRIYNCTIANNKILTNATGQLTVFYTTATNGSNSIRIYNSIFWNNKDINNQNLRSSSDGTSQNYSGWSVSTSIDPFVAGNGNINTDPLFINESGHDYRLNIGSPAIDTGANNDVPAATLMDIEGLDRIFNTTVDMGAYEHDPNLYILFIPDSNLKAALVGNASVNSNSDTEIQLSEANAYTTSLTLNNLNILDATGIEAFINIIGLDFSNNMLTELNVSKLTNLTALNVNTNNLTKLNIKNGNNSAISSSSFNSINNPSLVCVSVNDETYTNANWTNKDSQTNFSTSCVVPFLVDANATGNNDGSSWNDAFIDLASALISNPNGEFWVKAGTYIPGNNRTDTFTLTVNQKIYGGFNGTESVFSQRNVDANPTILSGDINGNDATIFSSTDPNRAENSYRIIDVSGDGIVIDGFIITNGNANGSTGFNGGPGLNMTTSGSLIIDNCIISRHTASGAGVIKSIDVAGNISITVNNTLFENNSTVFATCYYGRASTGNNIDIKFESCLFINNKASTLNNGSLLWFRQDLNGTQSSNYINCTFSDNIITSGTPIITYSANGGGSVSSNIYNSIFWNNLSQYNVLTNAMQPGASGSISNSISNNGFTGNSNASNTSNSDPLFINPASGDYTLQSTSPAVDAGNNSVVSTISDLAGNPRLFNTTVDLGAYEYNSTLSANEFELNKGQVILYPNPASTILNIQTQSDFKTISIFTILGKEVMLTNTKSIDVSGLSRGLYLVKMLDADGNETVKRFIKE